MSINYIFNFETTVIIKLTATVGRVQDTLTCKLEFYD
jgi:hypothetical protein